MTKELYEALKVIADECNKNPLSCKRCAFECISGGVPSCLLRKYNPYSLFNHINVKEKYEFDEKIRL